jgi:hypothetical protein
MKNLEDKLQIKGWFNQYEWASRDCQVAGVNELVSIFA